MRILLLPSAAAPAMVTSGTLCNVTEVVISLAEDILLGSAEAAHIASHFSRIPAATLLKDKVAQTSLVQEGARMLIRVALWAHSYVHLTLLALSSFGSIPAEKEGEMCGVVTRAWQTECSE
ncbi:hypothetical protein M378DRAFT_25698 [Amanita muscaria Koide BX008]|uniref:Uncharacterized protein n=1 Tax=Amanita muscaria (strain Koide BX008) TaxID=946122 RepID=A0A0C2WL45_AMAMK|nr:hypothetical protein M378DRAFT_25698 [Amanita muscaria Koide BX008]